MLKIQFIVGALLLISASTKAVPFSEEWNFKNQKVVGQVKKITFKYNSDEGKIVKIYNKKGEQILQKNIDEEGKVKSKKIMKYDNASRLTYLYYYSQYKTDEPRYIEKAEYSENGKLKSIKRSQGENGFKSDNSSTENISYSEGLLKAIKVKCKNKAVVFLYQFSDKGQLQETSRMDGNSNPKYLTTYSYDKKGNVTRTTRWKNGEKHFETKIRYLYDRIGNWIERTITDFQYVDGDDQKVANWTDYRKIIYYYN
jgi:YD repeat-containing protein